MLNVEEIPFIHGLELSRRYHEEVVGPLMRKLQPNLPYAAGRLDGGSDVLGFDTPLSLDHDWGPRLTIFLKDSDVAEAGEALAERLSYELPLDFHGYPTNYEAHEDGTLGMSTVEKYPIKHLVDFKTVPSFFHDYLRYDLSEPLGLYHWLSFPEQRLRTIRSGGIFHDDWGLLTSVRDSLDYYPDELWLYIMAVGWRRVDQEEPFMGRAGDAGDEIGSRLIAARQVYNVIRLCFLMEKQYSPYSKWLGTAFSKLECARELSPMFEDIWSSDGWEQRQEAFSQIYEDLAHRHNHLGITPPILGKVSSFHGRPYMVIHSERFVDALLGAISDHQVKDLPKHLGGIDQIVDSTDVLAYPERFSQLQGLLRGQ